MGGGKLGAGDRRHGHQGPQGPGRLPEGPRRRAGLRRQARRPAAQADEEGQGRHPERPTGPDHLAGDRRTLRGRQHRPGPAPDGRRARATCGGASGCWPTTAIKTIVLAADHGHLFADEIGEDMKIEAPGGKTEDLHGGSGSAWAARRSRRTCGPRCRRSGVDSDLDIATPWTFACLQVEGRRPSLLPRRAVAPGADHPRGRDDARRPRPRRPADRHPVDADARHGETDHAVLLRADRREPEQSSLFGFEPPKVRVEIRANKKCVSIPVSASYGFEEATGEVKLKVAENDTKRIEPNTVTVMIVRGDRPEDGGRLPARRHHRGRTGEPGLRSRSPFRCEGEPCLNWTRKRRRSSRARWSARIWSAR